MKEGLSRISLSTIMEKERLEDVKATWTITREDKAIN